MKNRRILSILLALLVLFLAACGVSEVPAEDTSSLDEEGTVQEIDPEVVFADRCARCHGTDRSGGTGPALLPETLTQDSSIYQATIQDGSGRMPSFGSRFSTDEINVLVDYLLSEPQ